MARLGKPVCWIVYFTCGVVLVLLSSQANQVSAEFKFLAVPQVPVYSVLFGTNFQLNCTTNDPNATTTLYRSSSPSSSWDKLLPKAGKLSKIGHIYTILDVEITDAGQYQCRARNNQGKTIKWPDSVGRLIPVKRLIPKVKILPIYPVVLTAGQFFNITCESVYGTSLRWIKKLANRSNYVVPSNRTRTESDETNNFNKLILMIKDAQKSDSGTYECLMDFQGQKNSRLAELTVYERAVPVITSSSGSGVVVLASNQTTLHCLAYGHPRPSQVSWYKNGKQITISNCQTSPTTLSTCKSGKYIITAKLITKRTTINSTFTILDSVFPDDQGNYTCRAVNSLGSGEKTMFVDVKAKPSLVQLKQFWQFSNSPAQVDCTVEKSNPPATFTWEYQLCTVGQVECPSHVYWNPLSGSHTVTPSPGNPTSYSRVEVPIDEEYASYRCTATNKYGNAMLILTFHRIEKGANLVQIKSPFKPLVTIAEEPFKLNCIARVQRVHWLKDGKTLSSKSDPRVNISQISLDQKYTKFILTVVNATRNDSGIYTCDVAQLLANDSIEVIVEARVKPNITGLVSQEVRENFPGYAELVCDTTTAKPKAKTTWYKKEGGQWRNLHRKISKGLSSTRGCVTRQPGYYFIDKDDSRLVICNPKHRTHTGQYQCIAENSDGGDVEQARLNILAEPRISKEKHREIKVPLGDNVNETCSATGNPVPDVVWTRTDDPNKKELSSGKGEALLVVKNVQGKSLGNYTCNATNIINSVTAILTIKESTEGKTLPRKDGLPTEVLIGIICGCLAFVLIVIVICLILYRRQKKQIDEYKELYFLRTGSSDYKIDPDRSLLEQCNNLPYDLDWEFPEERLILGEPLGSGAFGQVLKAEAIGMSAFKPRDKTPDGLKRRSKLRRSMRESKKKDEYSSMRTTKQTVAVKCLKEGASESDYKDLASELKILIHLGEHKNIVNVLGACTRGRRLMVIIEYAPHGNLLSFLRSKREIYDPNWVKTSNNPDQEFTLVDLGMTAYQISRGMEFLASRKCVHRDLAARNVLVGHNYVMKISDFGLARDIYQDDLYVKTTTGLLPVKWMALESLFDRVYTEKSDVWSFGVALWEIFTLGGTPYPGLPTEQLLDYLSEGNRMNQPQNCPLEMYAIMRDCWIETPEQRPNFAVIAERLGKILEKNVSKENPYIYLELDEDSGTTNYYLNPSDSNMQRKTADGYEEPLPTPRPQSSTSYNSPLPTLPPNEPESPTDDLPNLPLPSIPPTDYRNGSKSSNESGIDVGEKEKDRQAEQEEPLILQLDEEKPTSPGRKGKKRGYRIESSV